MDADCYVRCITFHFIVTCKILSGVVLSSDTALPNVSPLQPVAIVNAPLILLCCSNGDSQGIQWIRNWDTGEFIGSCDISNNKNYNVTCYNLYTKSLLEIKAVNAMDLKSNWSCLVDYNDMSQRLSNTVTLYEPTPIDSLSVKVSDDDTPMDINNLTTNASDTLTFTCITSPAYPDPIINWYISQYTDDSTDYIELEATQSTTSAGKPNGTVTVSSTLLYKLSREDNGKQIHCIASNNYSLKRSPSLRLHVQYTAEITIFTLNAVKSGQNTSVDIIRGSSLSYRCEVDSNPPAVITLLRGTTDLKVNDSGSLLTYNKEEASLKDEGVYSCNARNPAFYNSVHEQIYVTVVYGAEITLFLVNNERYESNVTLNETGSLRMICAADGRPTANVYIESKNTKCQTTQSGYGVCDISSTQCKKHAGLYTCQANNPFGNDTRSITVFVNCIPTISKNSNKYVTLIVNETVTFSATITAYPAPDVFWTLPNSSVTSAACHKETEIIYLSIQVCNMTFKVTNGNEYGTYRLTAYNTRGNKSIDFVIVDPIGHSSFNDQQPTPVHIGLVLGPVAGGLVVIAIIVVAVYFLRKRSSSDKGSSTERTQGGVYEDRQLHDDAAENHQYASLSSSTEPVPRQPQSKPEDLTYINMELKQ